MKKGMNAAKSVADHFALYTSAVFVETSEDGSRGLYAQRCFHVGETVFTEDPRFWGVGNNANDEIAKKWIRLTMSSEWQANALLPNLLQ